MATQCPGTFFSCFPKPIIASFLLLFLLLLHCHHHMYSKCRPPGSSAAPAAARPPPPPFPPPPRPFLLAAPCAWFMRSLLCSSVCPTTPRRTSKVLVSALSACSAALILTSGEVSVMLCPWSSEAERTSASWSLRSASSFVSRATFSEADWYLASAAVMRSFTSLYSPCRCALCVLMYRSLLRIFSRASATSAWITCSWARVSGMCSRTRASCCFVCSMCPRHSRPAPAAAGGSLRRGATRSSSVFQATGSTCASRIRWCDSSSAIPASP
mmetsp:Transcript_28447/g.47084  ORF Transcript_28447/g.47084 Transcript_28447/m.47084 type:complete len:270 (-) Transcript_28447:663-1472(-)